MEYYPIGIRCYTSHSLPHGHRRASVIRFLGFIIVVSFFFNSCTTREKKTLSIQDSVRFEVAHSNGLLANEGFLRSRRYVDGWLEYADSASGLIPRNIEAGIGYWNAKDAAADNYPFMVLTAFFVDQDMFNGKMMDMLKAEKRLTSRVRSMPDTYSFSKKGFLEEDIKMDQILFGTSEYIKDGLLPLSEWLGTSVWSDRMIEMLYDMHTEMDIASEVDAQGFGNASKEEVNGELLQVLSRMYWMTGDEKLLEWAIKIGDYYMLGDHHPTKDLTYLRLRDHGCELISGLCELYATTHFARPEKQKAYTQPLHIMLDRILEVGRNEDGFFYDGINPVTGEVVHERIADTWGYTLNGYYIAYVLDSTVAYKAAIQKVFSNLDKYKNFDWESGSADGYADAIESALNLFNRIPDPRAASWIDSEIQVMWGMQKESGIIEGWHGDGNFARTTIMHNLWKSQGLYVTPWRDDIVLGAVQKGDSLFISITSTEPWDGHLHIDTNRAKENMKLPMDWPRINQFPQWFTLDRAREYDILDFTAQETRHYKGTDLTPGVPVSLSGPKKLIIY